MDLTPDPEAEAQRIYAALRQATASDLLALARLLANPSDGAVFGRTEFAVRDRVHRHAAQAVELTLAGRNKRGTSGPAPAAPAAATPSSSATPPAGS